MQEYQDIEALPVVQIQLIHAQSSILLHLAFSGLFEFRQLPMSRVRLRDQFRGFQYVYNN